MVPQHVKGVAGSDKLVFAREQRRAPSRAEEILWGLIRGKRLGVKFRRQHSISSFVLDFYCDEAKLAVEVDGPAHERQARYDAWRDEELLRLGIRTVRIGADEVTRELLAVLDRLRTELS